MARYLTSDLIAAIEAKIVRPIVFLQIGFPSGNLNLWSGIGQVTWNGFTWGGSAPSDTGMLLKMSAITDTSEVAAANVVLVLSGIPSNLLSKCIAETRLSSPVKIWLGFYSYAGGIIADPAQVVNGRLDVPSLEEGSETSTISVTVESRMVDLQRARERRYTHDDQQVDHPGDLGFEYVPRLQDWAGTWGHASAKETAGGLVGTVYNLITRGRNPILQ